MDILRSHFKYVISVRQLSNADDLFICTNEALDVAALKGYILHHIDQNAAQVDVEALLASADNVLSRKAAISELSSVNLGTWQKICRLIGAKAFREILTNDKFFVFVRLESCVLQIAGKSATIALCGNVAKSAGSVRENGDKPKLRKRRRRNRKVPNNETLVASIKTALEKLKIPSQMRKDGEIYAPLRAAQYISCSDFRVKWPFDKTHGVSVLYEIVCDASVRRVLPLESVELLQNGISQLFKHPPCLDALVRQNLPLRENVEKSTLSQLVSLVIGKKLIEKFLLRLLRKIVPDTLIGSENWLILSERICSFIIQLKKREFVPFVTLFRGLKAAECPWIKSLKITNAAIVNRFLVNACQFLISFCTKLVKSCFYVTDTQMSRNVLVFYHKQVWKQIEKLAKRKFIDECKLVRLSNEQEKNVKNDCFSLRFVPKLGGARPLLASGNVSSNRTAKFNWNLKPIRAILRHICQRDEHLCGSAISSFEDARNRWSHFVNEVRRKRHNTDICMVKSDFHSCFNMINQSTLLDILNRILCPNGKNTGYVVTAYKLLERNCFGTVRKRPKFYATDSKNGGKFEFSKLANRKNSLYVVDERVYYDSRRVYATLERLIGRHYLKFSGGKVFRQSRGIPQGLAVSTILCDLYLGRMEREIWPEILRNRTEQEVILMRMVDDLLLATSDVKFADLFLSRMLNPSEEMSSRYNMIGAAEKTMATNLSDFYDILPVNETIPWCGLLFDCRTLEVGLESSRWRSQPAGNLFSLCPPAKCKSRDSLFRWYIEKVMTLVVCRTMGNIAFDGRINSKSSIDQSISELTSLIRRISSAVAKELKTRYGVDFAKAPPEFHSELRRRVESLLKSKRKGCVSIRSSLV